MEAILTLLDISENRDLQQTLTSREKLVAMGQLAAGVAHELNTPLGNIQGYVQLIKNDLPETGKSHEFATIVEDETRRCSRIIHDLLNFANREKCTGEVCDINQLLPTITDTFLSCRTRRYGIDIKMDLQQELSPVEGDCGQLEIVFTNLINNAIQALDGVDAPFIALRSWQEGNNYVYVCVEDNGPGIAGNILHNIFDPFSPPKKSVRVVDWGCPFHRPCWQNVVPLLNTTLNIIRVHDSSSGFPLSICGEMLHESAQPRYSLENTR